MKLAKKSLGYALAFTAGTLFSGSVAVAATSYVQAQKETTSVQYHGNTVSHPIGLVYGGTTYVQLYSIEQALKQAGFLTDWNGSTLSLDENSVAKLSGGTSDNLGTFLDIGYSLSYVQSDLFDFVKSAGNSNGADQSIIYTDNRILQSLSANIAALQKDTPSDSGLINVQNEYMLSLSEFGQAFNDFNSYLQTSNETYMNKFDGDYSKADTDFSKAVSDFQSLSTTLSATQSRNTNMPLAGVIKHNFNLK